MESEGSRRQSSEPTNRNRIRRRDRADEAATQVEVPYYPDSVNVNAAATWNEGYCTLCGEVCGERGASRNPCRKAWLSPQKSVWAIVPEKSVKADGGKGSAVAGNTACQESDVLKAVARERMSARG